MNADQIALQLYTVRQPAAQNFADTLRRVAALGYRAVELAGTHGMTIPDLRAALDANGLRAVAAHVRLTEFETRLDEAVAEVQQLGCAYAVVPWVAEERRRDLAAGHRLAAALNRIGAACAAAGLAFAYHHHDFEFAPLPDSPTGQNLLDLIVAETDPALVAIEIDVYWAAYAGVDPVALLHDLARRVPLLHVKDMLADARRSDAPVGDGALDWVAILATADTAGVQWAIVEQDNPVDPFADSERALRNLERLMSR
jgi:sugar phosphate isomerase/epimerase